MSILNKILIFLGVVVVTSTLAFIIYKQIEISKAQKAIESTIVKQKELPDNITRSESQYVSKNDIEKFIKDNNVNLSAIKSDLSKLQSTVTAVNTVAVVSKGEVRYSVPSTSVGTKVDRPIDPKNPDPYSYLSRRQELALTEDFAGVKVPIGKIGFSAWQPAPWDLNLLPREYYVVNVVGTDEDKRMYFYNKISVKTDGKTYDLKIMKAETKQEYPEAKWSWWNPRLFIGIDGGLNINSAKGEVAPNLNVSVFSYGRYKPQPDWTFLQVGTSYGLVSNRFNLNITPFTYNVGKHIPLMNNTYIGPSLHISDTKEFSLMGGIRVGL